MTLELHHVQQQGRVGGTVHRPATIDAALEMLGRLPDARPVAGGTDLLLDLARGPAGPPVELIDLTAISGFDDISETDDALILSGGVTHNAVVADERLVRHALPLAQACLEVGSAQLRNRATIAGNLATASPANDTISALMALGAEVEIRSANHRRLVPVTEFFVGFRRTTLAADELICSISVPKLGPNQRGLWAKLGNRSAQAISIIHAAAVVGFDADGSVNHATIAMGSVAPTVVLLPTDELVGHQPSSAIIAAAAADAKAAINPIDDVRASAPYRRALAETMIQRMLTALADDQQGAAWPDNPPTLGTRIPQTGTAGRVIIDGTDHLAPGDGRPLLDWLRDNGFEGPKEGCAEGECGACTVTLDGQSAMSCLVPAAQASGGTITTIRGLQHRLQDTFVDCFAVQCGFCTPGFVMAGAALLSEHPSPTTDEIRLALAGNLCRCTGYYPIIDAVRAASDPAAATPESTNQTES